MVVVWFARVGSIRLVSGRVHIFWSLDIGLVVDGFCGVLGCCTVGVSVLGGRSRGLVCAFMGFGFPLPSQREDFSLPGCAFCQLFYLPG